MMDGGKRERGDDHSDGPPKKRARLGTDSDDDGQNAPPPVPPPAPPPPPPPPPACSICLNALNGTTFAQDPVNGTITLVCQPGMPVHEFHGSCLQDWVYSSSFNPNQDGQIIAGVNFWKVLAPRCPLCRVRFVAATYWPAYAAADQYPDDGIDYQTVVGGGDSDDDTDSSSSDSDTDNSSSDEDEGDGDGYDSQEGEGDGDGDGGDDYSDSDDDVPYVANITCNVCNVAGPHDEIAADDLINTYPGPFACFICNAAIAQGDEEPVLRCRNCGAVSHYHD